LVAAALPTAAALLAPAAAMAMASATVHSTVATLQSDAGRGGRFRGEGLLIRAFIVRKTG
jgi:hypothetical protein